MSGLPDGPLLFDTGIYIRFSRGEGYAWFSEDARVFHRTILSVVVAAELYAGTRRRSEKQAVDELCRSHRALGHFSVPTDQIWAETGMLLRRARSTFGQVDFVRHFRDVLIAFEAIRAGATLVTENRRDFTRWKSLVGSNKPALKLFAPSNPR